MTIANGLIADANDIIKAQAYILTTIGEMTWSNWVNQNVTQDCYSLVKGNAFIGCANGDVGLCQTCNYNSNGTCGYILCETSVTDCFASTGCATSLTPTQYLGTYCLCTAGCACACVNSVGCLSLYACENGYGVNCVRQTEICSSRGGADCYRYCLCFCSAGGSNHTHAGYCFIAGGNTLANQPDGTSSMAYTLFEFRKIPGTANYCYFCNSSFKCCVGFSGGSLLHIYAYNDNGNQNGSWVCSIVKEWTECYNNPGCLITCPITFSTAPTQLLLQWCRLDSGTDTFCVDLLCCTGTCLTNIPASGCITNVSSYGLCNYELKFYTTCSHTNCNSCPVCFAGYVLQGEFV